MRNSNQEYIFAIGIGVILLITLAAVFIIVIIRYNNRQRAHLIEKQLLESQHEQQLLQTQLEIQEQTLKTVSEELHDNISQLMGLAKLNLSNLLAVLPEGSARPKAEAAKASVTNAINELRQLTRILHGDKVAETGIEAAIDAQLTIIQGSGAFTTKLAVNGQPYALAAKQEMVLFRMVQELLNNAVKHSGGNLITVTLDYQPTTFILTVRDNGKGFDAAALDTHQTGIGLTSLRNRAALINSKVMINSGQGTGTTITIELPLQ